MKSPQQYSTSHGWVIPEKGEFGGPLLVPMVDPKRAVYQDASIYERRVNHLPSWTPSHWRIVWGTRITVHRFTDRKAAMAKLDVYARHPKRVEYEK